MRREFVFLTFVPSLLAAPAAILTSISYFGDNSAPIQAVALDPAGNIYITGTTAGSIPLVNALQPKLGGGNCSPFPNKAFSPCPNIFVAKFDPTGSKLIYSTYLGGDQSDSAAGIAVGPDGSAYIAGTTRPVSPFDPPDGVAFVKKLNPDGSALLYTRYVGGDTAANGVAVDTNGNAFIVGYSIGTDFPSVRPLPVQPTVKSLYVTNDAGRTWRALNHGLNATNINSLAIDPSHPSTLFAATSSGLFKSVDAGANWTQLLPSALVASTVVVDPRRPSTVYTTYSFGVSNLARSTDGGATWTTISDNFPTTAALMQPTAFAIDPADSNVLWAIVSQAMSSTMIKSTDSGDHWNVVYTFPPDNQQATTLAGQRLLIDPRNSSRLYACCIHNPFGIGTGGVYRSDDGAKSWVQGDIGPLGGPIGILSPWLDPRDSSVLYGDWYYGLQRSADAGRTWNEVPLPPGLANNGYEPGALAVDASGTLRLLNDFGYLLSSSDRGVSWANVTGPWAPSASILAIDPTNESTIYVASGASFSSAGMPAKHAFIAKLDTSGVAQWATLLGGSGQDEAHAVAVDSAGNAYITGSTNSDDFPLRNAFQALKGRNTSPTTNAFVTKISADGSTLLYSSFLGGTGVDSGNAIAVDLQGGAYVAGGTAGGVFPVVGPLIPQPVTRSAASFVAKVDGTGSRLVYSTLLTGGNGYPTVDQAKTIVVDPTGRAIVAGTTDDSAFPLVNPIQPTFGLASNFIAVLSASGNSIDFSTYLGDLHDDIASLALASNGSLEIAGIDGLARIDFQLPAVQPGVPQVFAVYNAASYRLGDVVAPGEIVTLIGKELASVAQLAPATSLPRTMQDVSVLIGGVAAPLSYVSPEQINFQAPFEIPLGSAPLVIRRGTQMSAARTLAIVASAPGLFSATADPRGAPLVFHAQDFSPVTKQNPAHPGEYLAAYCTGLGATNPSATSGEPANGAAPITASSFAELDTGTEIPISYAGLAPGWIGVYQINFRLSESETPGLKQLLFYVGSVTSNQAPIWVQ